MGVLPLVFMGGTDRKSIALDGSEIIDILGLAAGLRPRMELACRITRSMALPARSPCSVASTRWMRSTTSSTAASCSMCCAAAEDS